ncbi:hypothetical protein K503DRAFT_804736 [Rhizopogon vinicolor AM-OR11-026]|uniref:Uncharacterized protein n=1 Tax=Rhizopogon vinicolor AM-OR11-026 TaxID=1314800 RepID=A0A1B7MK77_9AGAM|nr:hypothetical protein K503DRAFT_804736 [Rhizopogon vinicolor AM-OR11-026]
MAAHGGAGIAPIGIDSHKEMLALMLSLIITLCTESTGFVHGISQRSALASESRLHFATNLRLLTATRGCCNPNGAPMNVIMAVLLVMSYSAASMIINFYGTVSFSVAGFPLALLGVALLLQMVIALSGMRTVKILTWSSSVFDLTAALVHHTQLTPVPFQCMRAVSGLDVNRGPATPSKIQASAWLAHPSIRKVIICLWGLVVTCVGWPGAVAYFGPKYSGLFSNTVTLSETPWTFLPIEAGIVNSFVYFYPQTGNFTVLGWFQFCIILMVVQGLLTLGLHCSELVANVFRDERYWRCATGRKGLRMARSPPNLVGLVVFVAKAALHWMYSLSFIVTGTAKDLELSDLTITMLTVQIFNLSIALFIFASFFTLVALHRPRGPQPAAYGHLQTLANLVDEWSPVMWWGHKEDGIPYCHAGTSDHPLPPVEMDCVYASNS